MAKYIYDTKTDKKIRVTDANIDRVQKVYNADKARYKLYVQEDPNVPMLDKDFGEGYRTPEQEIDYRNPLGVPLVSLAADAFTRDPESPVNPYLNKDVEESKWRNLSIEDRTKQLVKEAGMSYEDAYNTVIGWPNTAYARAINAREGKGASTGQMPYANAKDIGSGLGRTLGAGVDQLLDPSNASLDNFTRSFAEIDGNVPTKDGIRGEERGFVGNMAQSMTRDPFLLPAAKAASLITKAPLIAGMAAKAGKFARPATLATEGAIEEVGREAVEGALGTNDFNPKDAALNVALSTVATPVVDKAGTMLKNKAKTTFMENILSKKNMKDYRPEDLDLTYETIPTKGKYGIPFYDYKLPKFIEETSSKISDLGEIKGEAYKDLSKFDKRLSRAAREAGQAGDNLQNLRRGAEGTVWGDARHMESALDRKIETEIRRLRTLVSQGNESVPEADEYIQELYRLLREHGVHKRFRDQTFRPPSKKPEPKPSTGYDFAKPKKKVEPPKPKRDQNITGRHKGYMDESGNYVAGKMDKPELSFDENNIMYTKRNKTDPNAIFNARKTVDREYKNAIAKLGGDKKLNVREKAVIAFRRMQNQAMEENTDRIAKGYKSIGDEAPTIIGPRQEKISLADVLRSIEETKPLEKLYMMRDAASDIGGGRIGGVSINKFGSQGTFKDLANLGFPNSGMRTRQIGEYFGSEFAKPKYKSFYRYDDDEDYKQQ